ncbi:hypothetical protein RB620_22385 [Paenibacillus sp. LHD-117]|uniref:hypothetical protein n=1 Tax=Paenibacillus sp. LHD-117 TaxID=3071412 RepID=UPI0027DF242A|nr:hypothetical protein [Paenibacillus sp. LHD-117]MDQ6422181.1 hypothetical protein [Paenibacillus sp. LHD-117]
MKQAGRLGFIALILLTLIIAGCTNNTPPKAALQEAMMKTMEADSYKLAMNIQLDELELPAVPEAEASGLPMASLTGMFQDAIINVDAVYAKDPMRMDMNMELVLPGMMEMKVAIPMIMTKDMLYVKPPEIPMLPLPEETKGKYVAIDLKELAKQQGAELNIDPGAQQKLAQELSKAVLEHFDEKTYFSEVKAADAGLPEGMKADQIVKFAITEENYPQTVETIVNDVLPQVLDILLANEAYLEALQVQKADLEKAKADWETNKTELLNVLQNDLKVNALEMTGAIKDKYMVYQSGKLGLEMTDAESGQKTKLGVSFSGEYSEIGKSPAFEELPTDTITLEQLMGLFSAPAGM